jgi:hypothetical protein
MRLIFIGLIFSTLFWNPAALARGKGTASPMPLFEDPGFSFSQVGTICLAPTLDLRSNATPPLALSESGPFTDFFHLTRVHGADQVLAEVFSRNGHQTAACNPVSATLTELTTPTDTLLRKLDFGQSNWLFVPVVEDVCISPSGPPKTERKCRFEGRAEVTGYAVVSGFLFQKGPDAVRIVWRDRIAGTLVEVFGYSGPRIALETGLGTMAVNDGMSRLLGEFEWRSTNHPLWLFAVDEENFTANCDAVWEKLKDALNKHPREYKVAFLDAADRMVLYFDHHGTFMEDHVVLRTHGEGCMVQVTQSFQSNARQTNHWDELIKEVRSSLPKQ